jgi:hypothetical protein
MTKQIWEERILLFGYSLVTTGNKFNAHVKMGCNTGQHESVLKFQAKTYIHLIQMATLTGLDPRYHKHEYGYGVGFHPKKTFPFGDLLV